jgi:hypothetical protein
LQVVENPQNEDGIHSKLRVVNTQAAMMLLQWLPDIQSHELQAGNYTSSLIILQHQKTLLA